ncbi:polyketide synthase for naphthopyrone YWA1 [Xylariaceae sp. FL0255]|nr:polyketide synthase for naphthopyrone YWA1 [Xylariaceae sp. FL0255]
MDEQGQIFLFGDQITDFSQDLRQLLRDKHSAILLSDLFSIYLRLGASDSAIASTFTTIYQLGTFIRYYGDDCKPYPSSPSYVALGMCTGQLAASALACASGVGELIELATQTVIVSYRTGLQAAKVRGLMGTDATNDKAWAYIVPKLQADVAESRIDEFSQSLSIPNGSRPYVGAITPFGVTISGPPEILDHFMRSPVMSDSRFIPTPVHAPYHSSLLHADSDVDEIFRCLDQDIVTKPLRLSLLSSSTGELSQAPNFGSALHVALKDILQQPLQLDRSVQSIKERCVQSGLGNWTVSLVGTNSQIIVSALRDVPGLAVQSVNMTGTIRSNDSCSKSSARQSNSKIAIIGYSGRFPGAANPEGLWKILEEGRDVHREIPADRFDVDAHYDPRGKKKNTSKIRQGCFIDEPGLFDSRVFNISPSEARQSDPAQRLALMTAYEALESAGIVPGRTPSTQRDRVGVFYGMTSDDWREVNAGQDVGTYYIPGTNRAFTPGRINYFFKFTGPSVNADTACSSSACAIYLACNSLWSNDCDTAIADGTNVMTNPDSFAGLDKGYFLCPSGNCKTFDDGANRYYLIQAVICGTYTNHFAEAESITRPNAGAQAAIFRRIFSKAGKDPLDVSYIEMYGTGTQAGDATEMKSVLEVFSGEKSGRSADKPLYFGSVKANVGHAESGSGVTLLIKVMLMLKHSRIPRNIGIKTKINSRFPMDLKERGILIPFQTTPWRAEGSSKRMAFLNNFSAAGGNLVLLLEDAPGGPSLDTSQDPRTLYVVTVSARTSNFFKWNTERFAGYFGNSDLPLASLAYTTIARRIYYNYRVAVTGRIIDEVRSVLEKPLSRSISSILREKATVVFAFTGQGSVYLGMGRDLYHYFAVFCREIDYMATIAQICQLALGSFGIVFGAVIGHSFGEYVAMHIAGVLSARDCVFLVGTRARVMQEHCFAGTHSMLAVKATVSAFSPILQAHRLEVACKNVPNQTVLAGLISDIERAQEQFQQVEPVLEEFTKLTKGVRLQKPSISIISLLVKGVIPKSSQLEPMYFVRQCREAVDLIGALESARSSNIISEETIYLEIGPVPSLRKTADVWYTINNALIVLYEAGMEIQWTEYHRNYDSKHSVMPLPAYAWELKNYWIQYENNWCLNKGELSIPAERQSKVDAEFPALSPLCQKILESKDGAETSSVLVESDMALPELREILELHKVNGVALFPSSAYASLAMALGNHLNRHNSIKGNTSVEVADMATTKPLLLRTTPSQPQLFRASAVADWAAQTAKVNIYSVGPNGETTVKHATCKLLFGDPLVWMSEWQGLSHLVRSRMLALRNDAVSGSSYLIKRGLAYKLFESCVEYGESGGQEATVRVVFKDHSTFEGGNLYFIDSFGHFSGFVMNATESIGSKDHVFLNHGWESMRCVIELSPRETYHTYVKMESMDGSKYIGDVYIFKDGVIVEVNKRVAFQSVPRKVLDYLFLGPASRTPGRRLKDKLGPQKATKLLLKKTKQLGTKALESKSKELLLVINAFRIISEETGVPEAKMREDVVLADVGVDFFFSLTVSARLREELNIEVDSSVFIYESDESLCLILVNDGGMSDIFFIFAEEIGVSLEDVWSVHFLAELGLNLLMFLIVIGRVREALVIEKQTSSSTGSLKTAKKVFFLFPDGSGSAVFYAALFLVSSDVAVVALNCLYLKRPQDMKCGGWSAGGISAYDVAKVLAAEGEEIAKLILLDTPNPTNLEKLPVRLFYFLNSVGSFGTGDGAPEWLLQHFLAFLDALDRYEIAPFTRPERTLQTVAIWAGDGVYKSTNGKRLLEQLDDTREMKWLLNERTSFGPNGWDQVIGAYHFSMMEGA